MSDGGSQHNREGQRVVRLPLPPAAHRPASAGAHRTSTPPRTAARGAGRCSGRGTTEGPCKRCLCCQVLHDVLSSIPSPRRSSIHPPFRSHRGRATPAAAFPPPARPNPLRPRCPRLPSMPSLTLQTAQRFLRFLGVFVVDAGALSSVASMGAGPVSSAPSCSVSITVGGPAAAAAALSTAGEGGGTGAGAAAGAEAEAEEEDDGAGPSRCLRSR